MDNFSHIIPVPLIPHYTKYTYYINFDSLSLSLSESNLHVGRDFFFVSFTDIYLVPRTVTGTF